MGKIRLSRHVDVNLNKIFNFIDQVNFGAVNNFKIIG